MTIRQQLKFSSILFGALLLLLVISNRLAAPFWLGTLLFILLILTTLFSIVQIISTLFHQWQLGRKEKWLIQHQAIQDLLTQGFKVVDHQFIEGTYKGFLIRVQYFRRQFNTEETNVQEYTGETVTTLYRGIKYSLFSQYTELDDEIFPIHYSTKHRLQLYMVDGL